MPMTMLRWRVDNFSYGRGSCEFGDLLDLFTCSSSLASSSGRRPPNLGICESLTTTARCLEKRYHNTQL